MATHAEVGSLDRDSDVLGALLRGRGLRRYGVFLASGEGKMLPDGSESESGYVIDESGSVHFYWLDWEAQSGGPFLKVWEKVSPSPNWSGQPEYHAAREAAGLGPVAAVSS